jgi:hypothetical protein
LGSWSAKAATGATALVVLVGGVFVAVAAAKPTVAAPTITAHPVAVTTESAATFAFSDSPASLSFECALDGAAFTACKTPKTYSGPLGEGAHTFSVRAVNNQDDRSSPSTSTWTVDRTPPAAPTLTTIPADPTKATAASFAFTSPEGGARYLCQLDGAAAASCSSPRAYPGPLPAGAHTFNVRVVDLAGLVGPPASFGWRIDLSAPPVPVITSFPEEPTAQRTATFAFNDTEVGVTLQCGLDGAAFVGCVSPQTYSGLSAAAHTFRVRAVDPAGNPSGAASYNWTIAASVAGFTLSGTTTQPLYPGATSGVNVAITNPFAFPIAVSALTVTVGAAARNGQPAPACDASQNVQVVAYSGPSSLLVAANATTTLAALGIPAGQWPQLRMPDLPINQDTCKGVVFALTYAASASKASQ